jgi:hypothetical protein
MKIEDPSQRAAKEITGTFSSHGPRTIAPVLASADPGSDYSAPAMLPWTEVKGTTIFRSGSAMLSLSTSGANTNEP